MFSYSVPSTSAQDSQNPRGKLITECLKWKTVLQELPNSQKGLALSAEEEHIIKAIRVRSCRSIVQHLLSAQPLQ